MSEAAAVSAALFGLWFTGSVCVAFDVPWASTWLQRVNQFRVFSAWTMFSAAPTGFTWYAFEYRDAASDEPWTRWMPFGGWDPFGWLVSPRQPMAEALQRLGRNFERRLADVPATGRAAAAAPFERLFADLIESHDPRQAPRGRDVRMIKTGGGSAIPVIVWTFTTSEDQRA